MIKNDRLVTASSGIFPDVGFIFRLSRTLPLEKRHVPWGATAFGLILGGALGNMTDRIFRAGAPLEDLFRGQVVDFVNMNLYAFWWPTYNVADVGIVAGILIFLYLVRRDRKLKEKDKEGQADGGTT